MTHFDEHILEVYVLGGHRGDPLEAGIEAHLAECEGCRELVVELRAIHEDLTLAMAEKRVPAPSAGALVRRRDALAPGEEFRSMRRYAPKSPIQRVVYYIIKYPAAAAAAGLSLALILVALGFLLSTSSKTSTAKPSVVDPNPASALFNKDEKSLEVVNAGGDKLWSAPMVDALTSWEEEGYGIHRTYLLDVDGDGVKEIVTSERLRGGPAFQVRGVHIVDTKRDSVRNITLSRTAEFRSESYALPVSIGGPIVTDTAEFRTLGIFTVAGGGRSPSALVRFDLDGNIIGEYWHFGYMFALYLYDVDGDGKKELVACAMNDVDDNRHLAVPTAIVLDPEKIVGVTESSASRGFGYAASQAERYYMRLPMTDINTTFNVNAKVTHFRASAQTFFLYVMSEVDGRPYEFEYEFARDMRPLDVKPSTGTLNLYTEMERKGVHQKVLDRAYRDEVLRQVRYWDGSTWSTEVARVGPPAANP